MRQQEVGVHQLPSLLLSSQSVSQLSFSSFLTPSVSWSGHCASWLSSSSVSVCGRAGNGDQCAQARKADKSQVPGLSRAHPANAHKNTLIYCWRFPSTTAGDEFNSAPNQLCRAFQHVAKGLHWAICSATAVYYVYHYFCWNSRWHRWYCGTDKSVCALPQCYKFLEFRTKTIVTSRSAPNAPDCDTVTQIQCCVRVVSSLLLNAVDGGTSCAASGNYK